MEGRGEREEGEGDEEGRGLEDIIGMEDAITPALSRGCRLWREEGGGIGRNSRRSSPMRQPSSSSK